MDKQRSEEEIIHEIEKKALDTTGTIIETKIKEDVIYRDLLNKLTFEQTKEGLRIEMIEESNNVFFELGSAKLSNLAKKILKIIATQLVRLPNKIAVEGHTDSKQYKSEKMTGYSNYELSAERANAARRELVNAGISDAKIDGIIAYADKRLKIKEDPFNHKNRRISIIVKYSEKK